MDLIEAIKDLVPHNYFSFKLLKNTIYVFYMRNRRQTLLHILKVNMEVSSLFGLSLFVRNIC